MQNLTIALAIFVLCTGCSGPIGPIPGGALSGELHSEPISSWQFAQDVEVIQLETNPSDPHSVNTWVGVMNNQLYIPTSLILGAENPQERDWVQHVLANPNVRLGIADKIYPVQLQRITDQTTITAVKQILLAKYAEDTSAQSDAAWIFQAVPRPTVNTP